jgi:hypothetical protein
MKPIFSTFSIFLIMFVVACAPLQASQPTAAPVAMPASTQPAVEATSQGSDIVVEMASATVSPLAATPAAAENETVSTSGSAFPKDGVTLSDNGKTFVMHVGESFLLNLGMDVYDWSPEVDNQDVLQRETGVAVIRGAQGIYIAKTPGTAILAASGNPLCLQSRPPCMRPSLFFSITVIVQ